MIDKAKLPVDSSGLREALGQTVSAKDFSSAAVLSMAENMNTRDNRVSYDLVRNLLDTVEAENHGTETDFRLETRDVSLAETRFANGEKIADETNDGVGRYRVLGHLGSGAAGQVFEVQDYNFDRKIAVKFLNPQAASRSDRMFDFINEAKLSASLEHPNILPIHDVNISDSGMLYFSMQKAQGQTLKELLDVAELDGHLSREIRNIADRVSIMISVCDAIAFAHSKGIVHQDIKPSNIMIGQYGEVVLVDWGTAARISEMTSGRSELVGTPIYMSPEQARREVSGVPSDIYCLGSTLFHVLTFRFPTWANDIDTFWEFKKQGRINPVTRQERTSIPGPLLSIALKALEPEVKNRYQSVSEMLEDLKRYQHGERVLAHKDTISDIWGRLYRHNKRAVWVACVGLIGVLCLGFLFYLELMKSSSEWKLYKEERFDNLEVADLSSSWQVIEFYRYSRASITEMPFVGNEAWSLENGALSYKSLGISDQVVNLVYRDPIPGDMRVEFDITPEENNQPIRCFIAGPNRFQAYHMHAESGSENPFFYITRGTRAKAEAEGVVNWQIGALAESYPTVKFEKDKVNHYRMEREGNHIRFSIDDIDVFSVYDIDALSGPGYQQFGIELSGSDIRLDNVVVYNRPLAEKVSPLAVADTYFKLGDYQQAQRYYETLVDAYPGTDVRAHSLYRLGRCYVEFSQTLKAVETFKTFLSEFPEHELSDYVLYETGRCYAMQRDLGSAKIWFRKIRTNSPENVRQLTLKAILAYYLEPYKDLLADNPYRLSEPEKAFAPGMLDHLAEIEKEWWHWSERLNVELMSTHSVWMSIPFMYIRLGQFEHVIKYYSGNERRFWPIQEVCVILGQREKLLKIFPNDKFVLSRTLLVMGKYDEYLEKFGHQSHSRYVYAMRMKDYNAALVEAGDNMGWKARAYLGLGNYQEIVDNYRIIESAYLEALVGLGQCADMQMEDYPVNYGIVAKAMLVSGREDEVFKHFYPTESYHIWAVSRLLMKAWSDQDMPQVQKLLAQIQATPFDYWLTSINSASIDHFIYPLFFKWLQDNDAGAFRQAVVKWTENSIHRQIVYFKDVSASLLEDNPEYGVDFALTNHGEFLKAMKAEIDGQPKEVSIQLYQQCLDKLLPHQVSSLMFFAKWRLEELQR